MPDIWDDNIRNTHNTGDLYAYAYGVCHGLLVNLERGHRDVAGTLAAFARLHADVHARLDEIERDTGVRPEAPAEPPHVAPFRMAPEPVTPIFVSDEKAGEQASE